MTSDSSEPAITIGVPVRNEVKRLPRLFDALSRQNSTLPFTLCLHLDNCIDGSTALVERLADALPFRVITDRCDDNGVPNAGKARARAMKLAMHVAGDGIVLTTDADSVPDAAWIAKNCAALQKADIVAGKITRAAGAPLDLQHRVSSYFDRLHALRRRLDPVPWEDGRTHHWTSGASLGFRASVYRDLGGFPGVPSGEDARLVDSAMRAGYRVRRDARVQVCTSSRRHGRAPNGLASALVHFDGSDQLPEVAHPDDEAWRFAMQAEARERFERGDVHALAGALRIAEDELAQIAAACVNGEAFGARVVGAPAGGMRQIGLAHAEAVLAARELPLLAGAA